MKLFDPYTKGVVEASEEAAKRLIAHGFKPVEKKEAAPAAKPRKKD